MGGGNGGFIETLAAHVHVADTAKINTKAASGNSGTWLIDPVDFTIAAGGGDMTGATITANLVNGNVTIMSTSGGSGNINVNVNDAVTWAANLFTLNAQNNININANLNASGTASLALEYGQGAVAAANTSKIITSAAGAVNLPASTTNFTTRQGSDGAVKNYTVITALGAAGSNTHTDLQGMKGDLALNYALGADIDASTTSTWIAGAGFAPVGTNAGIFTGAFDGLGHTITGLAIHRTTPYCVGLFGWIDNAVVQNVGLVNASVSSTSGWQGGGLVGYNSHGIISNSYVTGSVSSTTGSSIGGLVGYSNGATLTANFWDVTTSGMAEGLGIGNNGGVLGVAATPQTGVSGITTAQMHTQASFTPAGAAAGQWDFTPGTGHGWCLKVRLIRCCVRS